MARQKSELVSAFGTSFEIFKALAEEVYSAGGTADDLRRIIKERMLRRQIAKLIIDKADEIYPIDVFGNSIDELVKQGKYGFIDPDINNLNFKADEMHQCKIILRHFGKNMSTNAVFKALDEEDLRPATTSELLEFGSRYQKVQKQFLIAALGAIGRKLNGIDHVCFLDFRDGKRGLRLSWLEIVWSESCRFAAVRLSADKAGK